HAWLNRFRGLLIRWHKQPQYYLAAVQFACAVIVAQRTGLCG
ncbi:MAG: IS5/IS1182 family transposase, partial [Verrucomicrobiales bacterium]|nr:IS5/IS1182 family transposase [Verrucomicrobiales bacterium]